MTNKKGGKKREGRQGNDQQEGRQRENRTTRREDKTGDQKVRRTL